MNIKLAHFELLEEIGHGGLGIVFRAYDPSLNRYVAIKVLKDEFAQDPEFVQDFLRESQNAAAISHPHIAQVHFVGEHEGNYYMVMELVNGRSLEQMVKEDGPLPEVKALRIAIEVTEALKAGYVNQMIHGDIKPQNIVVGGECGAKLLDFGLAQLANVEVVTSESIWGSPYYISPERVGRKAEDFRSDIYSLGATLFETLVGHPPFEAETPAELALKRLNEKPPLLRTINPNISKRTEQIVNKMLNKNLLMRYLDYDALLSDLHKAEAGASGKQPATDTMELRRATGYITAPVPVATRSLLPTIIAVSLGSCILVGGFVYLLVGKKTSSPESPLAATPISAKSGSNTMEKPVPTHSAAPSGSYFVQEGASAWMDGPKWVFFNLPASLIGNTPLPQQKWGHKLAVPGSPALITIGVAKDAAADFLSTFPTASPTGELFYVKNPEGLIQLFNIFKLPNPPQNVQFQTKTPFGLVLLKSEGTASSPSSQPVAQHSPSSQPVAQKITSDTFKVQLGSAPWVDGPKWVFSKIPAGLVGNMPLPQGKWDNRGLTIPGSPASVLIAVAKDGAADFLSVYPAASPTGEQVELTNQTGEIHPFKVFKLANPPQSLQYKSQVPFPIIPLKI